jgi:hypothetical protein
MVSVDKLQIAGKLREILAWLDAIEEAHAAVYVNQAIEILDPTPISRFDAE